MPAMLRRQAHGARNTMNYIPSPTCRVHLAPPSSVMPWRCQNITGWSYRPRCILFPTSARQLACQMGGSRGA